MISREMTTELQRIFQEEFNKKLPFLEADGIGNALLKYNQLLLKMSEKLDSANNPKSMDN